MNAKDKASVELIANSIGSERNVVDRIRHELERRGWSQAELSRRMESHASGSTGGVIHPVVLSKLLSGDRGRHVSIDQLVTLAAVFDVSVAEMLLPPGALQMADALRALADGPGLQRAHVTASAHLRAAQDKVARGMLSGDLTQRVLDDLEAEVAKAESQGYALSESIRATFLTGVVDRFRELKEAQDGE